MTHNIPSPAACHPSSLPFHFCLHVFTLEIIKVEDVSTKLILNVSHFILKRKSRSTIKKQTLWLDLWKLCKTIISPRPHENFFSYSHSTVWAKDYDHVKTYIYIYIYIYTRMWQVEVKLRTKPSILKCLSHPNNNKEQHFKFGRHF